jgi:hypothetical protein
MRILSLLIFYIVLISSNRLTDSPHGSDFKISCSTCHSADGWQFHKAIYSFDHNTTKLPLLGRHQGFSCADCHENSSDYSAFTCISCHEHNKADMDKKHREEAGRYSYNSDDCFKCHPRGNAG